MHKLAGKFAVCAVFVALAPPASYAQPFPESARQKSEEARKAADAHAVDEAYKALAKRTPSSDKKFDPWGGMRPSPAAGSDKLN